MALFKLWTGWGESNAITAPMAMINWRMLATFINELTGSSLVGWIVAALGITATVSAVYMIVKHTPHNGSPQWVLGVLGVFTATMLVTWHSHHHMALVLIPLLFLWNCQKSPAGDNSLFMGYLASAGLDHCANYRTRWQCFCNYWISYRYYDSC